MNVLLLTNQTSKDCLEPSWQESNGNIAQVTHRYNPDYLTFINSFLDDTYHLHEIVA